MEWIFFASLIFALLTMYCVVTGNVPTMKSLRGVPVLNSIEARSQGHKDMRMAVESSIVEQDYLFNRQAIEEEHAKRMKERYNMQEDEYSNYSRLSDSSNTQSKAEALEALDIKYKRAKRRVGTLDVDTVASFVVKWETANGKIFPFDPSKGQTGEYYFGADSKTYDNYIEGGMEYLNELNNTKSKVIERTTTINSRRTLQTHVNRQIMAATEAQHMLQIEASTSAQKKFEEDMQKIMDQSKMIEGS